MIQHVHTHFSHANANASLLTNIIYCKVHGTPTHTRSAHRALATLYPGCTPHGNPRDARARARERAVSASCAERAVARVNYIVSHSHRKRIAD